MAQSTRIYMTDKNEMLANLLDEEINDVMEILANGMEARFVVFWANYLVSLELLREDVDYKRC